MPRSSINTSFGLRSRWIYVASMSVLDGTEDRVEDPTYSIILGLRFREPGWRANADI